MDKSDELALIQAVEIMFGEYLGKQEAYGGMPNPDSRRDRNILSRLYDMRDKLKGAENVDKD